MTAFDSEANHYYVFSVSGATASGIRSLSSATGTLRIFRYALRWAKAIDGILLCIGEIDVGYLAWVRGPAAGITPESYLDITFSRLTEFVRDELIPLGVPVYLVSVSHPTVTDYSAWPDSAFGASPTLSVERKQVRADIDARIELTRYWNAKTERWCSENGVRWLDLTPVSTDAIGRVLDEWDSDHPLDHHLDRARYRVAVDELVSEAASLQSDG